MTIICSWCRGEGQTGVVGEKAPLDDRRETHGICVTHRLAVQARWKDLVQVAERVEPPLAPVTADREPAMMNAERSRTLTAAYLWSGLKNLTRKAGL